jgi:hypothetical protein
MAMAMAVRRNGRVIWKISMAADTTVLILFSR